MVFRNDRVLETESMETLEEIRAYDLLTLKYLTILHNGFVESVLGLSPASGSFLEVGCGTGRISIGVAKLAEEQITLTAVDISENMLAVARDNAQQEGVAGRIDFQTGDGKRLPFGDAGFDAVYCHNMLHHVPEPINLVREMHRVAKPGGAILIRDLVRVSSLEIPLHVHLLGLTYTRLMKKEYRDSIKAALSKQEWREMAKQANIEGAVINRFFITHQGLERPAANRRKERITVPTPCHIRPFKNMYVSPLISLG
ncbi:MAG: class I SAM-dependent methyltransferase [Desulfovibrionales bacterium]|nr:MAG: class I SAM-dependent methyltransferase [Desulfovibrionales bacterium]